MKKITVFENHSKNLMLQCLKFFENLICLPSTIRVSKGKLKLFGLRNRL